jgi:hypothetical protein
MVINQAIGGGCRHAGGFNEMAPPNRRFERFGGGERDESN